MGYLIDGPLSSEIAEPLRASYGWLMELSPPTLTLAIFANNSLKTLAALLLGVIIAIPPLLFILLNGILLGLISFETVKMHGVTVLLAGIVPHGILEVPAAIISASLGVQLGLTVIHRLRGCDTGLKRALYVYLLTYASRVLPLLLAAAIVEVFVTPLVLNLVKV